MPQIYDTMICFHSFLPSRHSLRVLIHHFCPNPTNLNCSIAPEKDNADAVVAEIEALGGQAIALEADCSQPDQIKAMFKAIKEKWGRCDVLVNNAGIARDSLMLRMKPEQWQQVIDINLTGVYYVSQEFFKVSTRFTCTFCMLKQKPATKLRTYVAVLFLCFHNTCNTCMN